MELETDIADKLTADAKRLASETGVPLPDLLREMQAEEAACRDCWNCETAIPMSNGNEPCPHCGAANPWGEAPR